jgi:hypothetical protein
LFTVAEDIREVDLDGRGDLDGGYAVPNEFHIHTELFRAVRMCRRSCTLIRGT